MTFEKGQRVRAENTTGDRKRFEGREGVITEVKDTLFSTRIDNPWIRVLFDGSRHPRYLYATELTETS